MRESVGRDEIAGIEIGPAHLVPAGAGTIVSSDARPQAAEAGIVDNDIEAAEMADHIGDRCLHCLFMSQVATKEPPRKFGRGKLGFYGCTFLRIASDEGNGRPLLRQTLRDPAPNSRIAAGDQGHFAFESHCPSLSDYA